MRDVFDNITATASIHSNSKFIRLAMLSFFETSYRRTLMYGEGDESRPRPAETALPKRFKSEIIAFVEESSKKSDQSRYRWANPMTFESQLRRHVYYFKREGDAHYRIDKPKRSRKE
jgi:hypothetical protein